MKEEKLKEEQVKTAFARVRQDIDFLGDEYPPLNQIFLR